MTTALQRSVQRQQGATITVMVNTNGKEAIPLRRSRQWQGYNKSLQAGSYQHPATTAGANL